MGNGKLSMNRIFVTSDTHFGHKNIMEFEKEHRGHFSSLVEHDEFLIEAWNSVVSKHDTVWHLGDVLFGKENFKYIPRLNGIKNLVLGNHDTYGMENYLKYFNKVVSSFNYKQCILTHIPIHESQFWRYKKNIHGHLHSKTINDPRCICVSVEQNNLKPFLLSDLI